MPAVDMPPAEVPIDEELVRRLLAAQAPEHADLPVTFAAEGWDNALYRVGEHLVARLPRRLAGAALVEHEQTWLGRLAPGLPLPVPVPIHAGRPADDYPWQWSLCPWFEGRSGAVEPVADGQRSARLLGSFVAALHRPAPADAPRNPHRGQPLADRDDRTRAHLAAVADAVDTAGVGAAWERALAVPPWPGPPVWLHGDLHPGNVLVHDGALSAIVDFGDLCGGDPATDLGIGWMLFGPDDRAAFRAASGVDDDTWDRGRGWAITHGLAVLASSADVPAYTAFARRAIVAATTDPYSR